MVNVLRMGSGRHGATGAKGVERSATGGGIVASLVTVKTTIFSDISGMFCGSEL